MENIQVQTDNFSIESWTAGSRDKAVSAVSAQRVDRTIFKIEPDKLTVLPDFNPRIETEALRARVRYIADSIKANGFYAHKPIACIIIKQDGQDVIVPYDGHTRLKGAKLAISEGYPLETVYISVAPAGTTLEDVTVGFVTNNTDGTLQPLEIGFVCKRLQGYGLDNTTIAKRLGLSVAYVGQLFELVGSDKKIRDMVSEGKVSATLAVQTIKAEGEHAAEVLKEAVQTAEQQGKVKATAKHVKRTSSPKKTAPAPIIEAETRVVKESEPVDNSPVMPLMQSPSVTPFDAKWAHETLIKVETTVQEKGIEWMKRNTGIIDHSHFELIMAMTGANLEDLKDMLK